MNLNFASRAIISALLLSFHVTHGQTNLPQTNLIVTNEPERETNPLETNSNSPLSAPTIVAERQKHLVVRLDETTLTKMQPKADGFWKTLQPFLSTLLGAVIALAGGYWSTTRSHELQVIRKKQEDGEFVERVEAAIATELEILGKFYENGIGKDLTNLENSEPLRVRLALTEKWFTVFEANANHLGRLDEGTSQSVIRIYGLMKSMLEYFRINNLLLDQLDALEQHLRSEVADANARQNHDHLVKQMVRLVMLLKDLETNLKREVGLFQDARKARNQA